MTPILSSVVLLRTRVALEGQQTRDQRSSVSAVANGLAVFCNLLLIAFSCWAIVAQYPHPKEEGVIAAASLPVFTVLAVFTPIVSVVVLLGSTKRKKQVQQRPIARQQ